MSETPFDGPVRVLATYSGGLVSYAAAKRAIEKYGPEGVVLLFADTMMEDADLYRFLDESAALLGVPLVRVADGRNPWEVFIDERFIGNSRVDPCSKKLKRELMDRWRAEHCDPAETVCIYGLDWSERHRIEGGGGKKGHRKRMAEAGWKAEYPMNDRPYLTKEDIIANLRSRGVEPPRLYGLGYPHNNCLSGDTEFITDQGIRRLSEMAGVPNVSVLGVGGGWKDATICSFGVQPLLRLAIRRYGVDREIYTTADHRWFIRPGRHDASTSRVERLTSELTPGDRLASIYGQLGATVRPSAFGIAQGIVFGDGTFASTTNGPAHVVLCGEKDRQLLEWFPLSPTANVEAGIRVGDLPRRWKALPSIDESNSFLYGWLSGYFAADGTAKAGGEFSIASAWRPNLEFVRDACARLGIGAGIIRRETRPGLGVESRDLFTLPLVGATLREDFFLIDEHRSRFMESARRRPADWQVISVEPTDRVEEVFCAVVPDGRAFALAGNILTGNCGGFCVKMGHAQARHLLRTQPELYRWHEEQELAAMEAIGPTAKPFLRYRSSGKTEGVTMRDFRERAEWSPLEDLINQATSGEEVGWGCGGGCAIDDNDENQGDQT